jgi:hypothetical protein
VLKEKYRKDTVAIPKENLTSELKGAKREAGGR